MLGRIVRGAVFALIALIGLLATAWACGALYFDLPLAWLRAPAAVICGLAMLAAPLFVKGRARAAGVVAAGFVAMLAWWLTLTPRQDRAWKPEVAQPADATVTDEQVTIRNVRNFEYRTETDFTPGYDNRTYTLSKLRGLDMFVTYWGSPLIAHPIVSFDFREEGRICFSIETRAEVGEAYSALRGFYRQFELIYIAADERDVIRLRTNFRKGEDVYLYHLNLPLEEVRGRFLEYARRIQELHARAEWYNAVTTNCTTSIRSQHSAQARLPWDWRILANGKGDEMLYERGVLDRSQPFAQLKHRAHINERARTAADALDFSERIRAEATAP